MSLEENGMPLNRKDSEAVRLIREEYKALEVDSLAAEVMQIGRHFAALPIREPRSIEKLLADIMLLADDEELAHE